MISSYEGEEGYVSLWVGTCSDFSVLDQYLTEKDEDFDEEENGFLPANQNRACEEELKEYFSYAPFNQFEYDFGLTFDDDFREAGVFECGTRDIKKLLEGFSNLSDLDVSRLEIGEGQPSVLDELPECNAVVALYEFKYQGGISKVEHQGLTLYFLGYVAY